MHRGLRSAILLIASLGSPLVQAELPPVPVPAENPITEPKRVLGKILFWDEQLSSDNMVACGTCHRPAWGGADARAGVHPGTDAGTIDDVHGSPGIVSLDGNGRRKAHALFGDAPQVTRRLSPSIFGALWAAEVFWDGRARSEFRDPLSGEVAIAVGGALESQVVETLNNDAEMAKTGQRWKEVTSKLERVRPLALASALPNDVVAAVDHHETYPALFAAAFGDTAITPTRIAFAIATYERTLVADTTPWDRYIDGDEAALSRGELFGWQAMQDFHCVKCHTPPLFTNNEFFNIGLRRTEFDRGREAITHDPEDAGEVRVPSLRNAGLRSRFMHTGEFAALGAAVGFYRTGPALPDRDDIPGTGIYSFNMSPLTEADMHTFLSTALTDPRVRAEEYPFDRPKLRTERTPDDTTAPRPPTRLSATRVAQTITLSWEGAHDDTGVTDYIVEQDGVVIALVTETSLDSMAPAPGIRSYAIIARDAAGNEAPRTTITLEVDTAH
jgi:cytochrome c peroxidase